MFRVGIPYSKTFFLECRNVIETRVMKRLGILWIIWARNKESRTDFDLFVASIRVKVEENPDSNSTIGLFILIKLYPIK